MSTPVQVIDAVRKAFPAIVKNPDYIHSENAGGSQVLGSVAAKISSYLLESNVQMADYKLAYAAKAQVDAGYAATALYLGHDVTSEEVMFGSSATQLVETLSRMIEESIIQRNIWVKGDEIVISEADHETNRGAWKRLAARHGLVIKHWTTSDISANSPSPGNNVSKELHTNSLADVVTERTRLVCFTACSNVLGSFVDIPAAVKVVKEKSGGKAWTCVDAVAYAPHRRPKPKDLGVDFLFWSWYKVYGPHLGTMYLSLRAQEELLTRLNHHFLHSYPGTYPFQPSSQQYELIASVAAIGNYFAALGNTVKSDAQDRTVSTLASAPEIDWVGALRSADHSKDLSQLFDAAYDWIASHENEITKTFLRILRQSEEKSGFHIVGDAEDDPRKRAPTIAFVADGKHNSHTAKQIHSLLVDSGKMGAQQGHMYAYDLIKALGLDLEDGVVRVSFVHYNTIEEAQKVGETLTSAPP
ncbi:hypothetical protein CF319_g5779 [Tilletia indica]|nr:hypothetical protein CF319_g5779 [Tilletia indica]